MDLFDHVRETLIREEQPLAARMRPRTLEEYIGQDHILAPGRLLRRAIQADRVSSLIFYGPPGTGKTTLASVIANTTQSHFEVLNAVLSGVKDVRRVTEAAQSRRGEFGRRTILFVDEVHRWNKAQQDALLPWVENGTVVLIGATTENPFFTVNRALVSRSRIFQLKQLNRDELVRVAAAALSDPERGYGTLKVDLADDALAHLVDVANGDARALLNALELAVETTEPAEDGLVHIDMTVAEESIQRRAVLYDKEGDYHFDTISAFIKSLRGSDPDAALYWMAKMVYAGEDPRFLFRRMLIFCGEDVGLADPNALPVVAAAAEAFDRVGMPEGRYHIGMATIYLATCRKSNSVMGFFDALAAVEKEQEAEVPNHLRDASRDKEGFGHGEGYLYPHAYRDHWVAQQYLPDSLQGKVFYHPGDIGYEERIAEDVQRHREAQLAAAVDRGAGGSPPEILTFSPEDRMLEQWLSRAVSGVGEQLQKIRTIVFETAGIQRHHVVLDLAADTGLFTWEALRCAPEGGVWALTGTAEAAQALDQQGKAMPRLRRPTVLVGSAETAAEAVAAAGFSEIRFDTVIGRNALTRVADRVGALSSLGSLLGPGGMLVLAETIPRPTQRLYRLVDEGGLPAELRRRLEAAEEQIYTAGIDDMVNWDAPDLASWALTAAFAEAAVETLQTETQQVVSERLLDHWFSPRAAANGRRSYASRLADSLTPEEMDRIEAVYRRSLSGRTVAWTGRVALLKARSSL